MKQMIEKQGMDIAEDMNALERRVETGNTKEGIKVLQRVVNTWVEKFESQLNVASLSNSRL